MVRGSVRVKEYVVPTRLRPSPPPPPSKLKQSFKAGDEVDVFRESEGCWVRGNVTTTAVVGNSRYIVEIKGSNRLETEVDYSNLRLHRDWVDGVWLPSLLQQDTKLKIKIKRRREHHQYEKGDIVEVRSEQEPYIGSWYCARILCIFDDNKYIVEHLIFRRRVGGDDDESIPLRDLVEAHNIRPVPAQELSPVVCYEPGDEVDAWFNKRWWIGRVSKVLGEGSNSKYLVYFVSTGEESIILDFNLRPHKDWINGEWVNPSKECYESPWKKLKTCERAEKVLFNNGMMVEVRSDDPGYEGAWYTAKIISYLGGNKKYIVEYQTLKTDDESELLKEEARGSDIRPIPP